MIIENNAPLGAGFDNEAYLQVRASIVGTNAARMAIGLGAKITMMDVSLPRLTQVDSDFGHAVATAYSSHEHICDLLPETDLLIGGLLIPGNHAPKLTNKGMQTLMRPGSVRY